MNALIFLLWFWSLSLFSQQSFNYQANNSHHFVEAYQYDDKWIIDHYKVSAGKLQERMYQRIYLKKSQWEKKLKQLQTIARTNSFSLRAPDFGLETEDERNVVWVTKEQWSLDWESKFQVWVRENVNPTFFKSYRIATDCADVMFALRWIFSRIHYLPMGNTLAGSRKIFSNESFRTAWSDLSRHEEWHQDKVFLAALDYVLDNTYTATLYEDSIPVSITPSTFGEGNFFLTMRGPQEMGHTEVVYNINQNPGKIKILFSDVPRMVRRLFFTAVYPRYADPYKYSMRSIKWITKSTDGKWRFVRDILHPHYSLYQFSDEFKFGFKEYYNALFYHLGLAYDYEQHYKSLKQRLMDQLLDRVQVVKEGLAICLVNDCSPGTELYGQWSTPSRDAKVVETFLTIESVLYTANQPALLEDYMQWLNSQEVTIDENKNLNMRSIQSRFIEKKISSDPRDSLNLRWGFPVE